MSIEDEFNSLAQDVIRKAGKIECSIREYADGLQLIAEEVLTAADAAESDLKHEQIDQGEDEG